MGAISPGLPLEESLNNSLVDNEELPKYVINF